jgi:hypothetical protein
MKISHCVFERHTVVCLLSSLVPIGGWAHLTRRDELRRRSARSGWREHHAAASPSARKTSRGGWGPPLISELESPREIMQFSISPHAMPRNPFATARMPSSWRKDRRNHRVFSSFPTLTIPNLQFSTAFVFELAKVVRTRHPRPYRVVLLRATARVQQDRSDSLRIALEQRRYAPSTINLKLAAVRRLACAEPL